MSAKGNPYRMWIRLRDRYAVSNTAIKVPLQSRFSRLSYKGQSLQESVDSFEEIFNRLTAMSSDIDEELQVAMMLASFGDKKQSPFGHVFSSLQKIQEKLDWETTTASLLREYDENLLWSKNSKVPEATDQGQALAANGSGHRPNHP